MRVATLLDPSCRFGPEHPTAVDLCTRDGYLYSRYKDQSRIFGREGSASFTGVDFVGLKKYPVKRDGRSLAFADEFLRRLRDDPADVIVVQQSWRAAGHIARRTQTPVFLHTHAFMRNKKGFTRSYRERLFGRLAGMIFVSQACLDDFRNNWGDPCPLHVGHNGIDVDDWNPLAPLKREKVILFAGRALEWKGVIRLVEALPRVLDKHPDWRARFIMGDTFLEPDYSRRCLEGLKAMGDRVTVELDQPQTRVRELCETAAIGVTPSLRGENFPRVVMELMAGGAAVVSSGVGGMKEVSGDHALYVEPTPDNLAGALDRLIVDDVLRANLQIRGHERARTVLDIRVTAGVLDDIYDSALARA